MSVPRPFMALTYSWVWVCISQQAKPNTSLCPLHPPRPVSTSCPMSDLFPSHINRPPSMVSEISQAIVWRALHPFNTGHIPTGMSISAGSLGICPTPVQSGDKVTGLSPVELVLNQQFQVSQTYCGYLSETVITTGLVNTHVINRYLTSTYYVPAPEAYYL